MLQIIIPGIKRGWDESKQEFVSVKEQSLQLEHSLISLSKWESKWCKPFIDTKEKTDEEVIDYIKCMTLTPNVKSDVYRCLTDKNIQQIDDYINAPMTATTIVKRNDQSGKREVVTSELIYYWMISLNIPMECQKWHLNRLLTLIRVCSIKNSPPKKIGKAEMLSRNRTLNEARKKKLNTAG